VPETVFITIRGPQAQSTVAPGPSVMPLVTDLDKAKLAFLPIHQPTNTPGLSLAGDELLFVTQRDEPALAT